MNAETIARLSQLNRNFYSSFAGEFGESREHAWPGWTRILDLIRVLAPTRPGPIKVLDIGCGNGRWGSFLDGRVDLRYVGIDESEPLLSQAARRLAGRVGFALERHDILTESFRAWLQREEFDVVALFGVLHHIPSRDRRKDFVAEVATHVAEGGLLALSFWRFGDRSRFKGKIMDWSAYNSNTTEPILTGDLEPGDHLLSWGSGTGVRYCHFADDEEIAEISDAARLERILEFTADGKTSDLNRYVVLGGSGQRSKKP